MTAESTPSDADLQREVARLRQELAEALAGEAAIAEVLST